MLRELSLVGQALSDPIRLRILKLLAQRDLCVCELVYLLPATQSRVSQNLALLKNANLVSDRREGRWVHYALNRTVFEQALADFRAFVSTTSLDDVPEMSVEAERWARMAVDNPRGVCQPEPLDTVRTTPQTANVMAPIVVKQ
jgi:ArsR family transcriptional regulator, arsenate/arsenite/antimonite-responsive transcriptional repressor